MDINGKVLKVRQVYIYWAQDRGQWRAAINEVIKIKDPKKMGGYS